VENTNESVKEKEFLGRPAPLHLSPLRKREAKEKSSFIQLRR
jgi:hypothetical protein